MNAISKSSCTTYIRGLILFVLIFNAASAFAQAISTFAGNGSVGSSGDNGLALNAMLSHPFGVCADKNGNVFVVSDNKVRKIDAAGIITTIAGNGVSPNTGDGGPAINAYINQPHAVEVDATGNIYISETGGHRIRKISALTGIISTIAGNGFAESTGDGGLAANARVNLPSGLALDGSGNLFFADMLNHRIRKIDALTGIITTVAGNGGSLASAGDGALAVNASIPYPQDVCVDLNNNLYITEEFYTVTSRVRKVDVTTGIISTIAGNSTFVSGGDGGPATSATFNAPRGITTDRNGNVYISESSGGKIRKIDTRTCIITTIAGNGTRSYSGDGGPATNAGLHFPMDVCIDKNGILYISDFNNQRIRKMELDLRTQVGNPSILINSSSAEICYGTSVTFTSSVTNEGTNPVYQWKVNGTSVGTNNSTYTSNTLVNGDVITCILSVKIDCIQTAQITSNAVTVKVKQDIIPEVITTASSTDICSGTTVTFTAFNKNGNQNPSYQWTVDGKNVGTDNPVYSSSTIINGSVVLCRMTVPQCNGTTKDDSDPITITVSPVINPSVVISASSTVVCKNSIVTFTANANDAGTNENYTWKVNGNSVGSNSKTYSSSSLNNGDIVTCELSVAPSVKCAVNTKVVSNSIAIKVTAPPKVLVQIIASDNDFCGTKPVVFKASIQNAGAGSIYQWQLNGNKVSSDNESYINNNPVDGDEIKIIVTYTDPYCSLVINDTSNIIKMSVKLPPVIFIAPSDTTVALGSSVQLNSKVTGSIASVSWSPANNVTSQTLSPVTTPLQAPVKYKLDVVATNGCSASKEAVIKVITEFNMPNSFTPNGDGKNDVFRIPPGVTMQLKEFSIFDRWGKKIFTTSDINKGWDGNYNNIPLGTGTYIYIISGTGHQGQGINAKGTLLVIR